MRCVDCLCSVYSSVEAGCAGHLRPADIAEAIGDEETDTLRNLFIYTFYTIFRMYSYTITHSTPTRLSPWLFCSHERIASATIVRKAHEGR